LAYAGLAWWHLGHPDRAVARSSEAVALAERLSHPQSQALALVWAAWVRQLRREPAEVRALAEAAVALCVEQGFPLWRSMGEILGGWAQGEAGETGEGLCRLGGGLEALAATGAGLWRPSFLALLAEVLARAGRVTDGLGALEQAIGASRERGELFYAAELERLRGELLWRHGAGTVTVEARFRDALTMAQHQQSRSLQLRAASSLARLWRDHDRLAEAQDLLMPVYGWFTEGFETPDLRAAKTLLEDVASARIASPPSPRRRAAP
jgi:predicted ATPase